MNSVELMRGHVTMSHVPRRILRGVRVIHDPYLWYSWRFLYSFFSLWWKRHGMALEFLTSYFITNLWNFDSVFIKRCFCVKFSKDAAMSINTPFLNESSFISIKCNDAQFKNTLFTQRSFQCLLNSLLNPPSYW